MASHHHGASDGREHVGDTDVGITGSRSALGVTLDPISETSGAEFDFAKTYSRSFYWKPATPADPDSTRAYCVLGEPVDVGAMVAHVSGQNGPDAAYRIRGAGRDEEVETPAVMSDGAGVADFGVTDNALAIDADASWTWVVDLAANPKRLVGATGADSIVAEVRAHATTSDNTTRFIQLRIGSTGQLLINFARFGGSLATQEFAFQLDDCLAHSIEMSFAGTGSGGTLSVYGDGVLLGTMDTAITHGATSVYLATWGSHWVGRMEYWSTNLSASQLPLHRYKVKSSAIPGLEIGLMFTATDAATPASVANAVGSSNYDMPLAAREWSTIGHPSPALGALPTNRHQPWRKRHRLRLIPGTGGAVRTTSSALATTPLIHLWFRLRVDAAPDATADLAYFGSGSGGNNQIRVQLRHADAGANSGKIRIYGDNFNGTSTPFHSSIRVDDGVERTVSVYITWGEAVSLGFDGTEDATGTANSYTSATGKNFTLHHGSSCAYVSGPIVVSSVIYGHARAHAVLSGEEVLIPGRATSPGIKLFYGATEGAGSTVANAKGTDDETNGDMTISSASALWEKSAVTNPSTSAGIIRRPQDWLNMAAWEIAVGANVELENFIIELFDPTATDTRVWGIQAFPLLWLTSPSAFESGSIDIAVPEVQRAASGGVFPGAGAPGREVSYGALKLDSEKAMALVAEWSRAPQVYRDGSIEDARPCALVHRSANRHEWREKCAVVQAKGVSETVFGPPHTDEMSRGVELRGIELWPAG